VMHDVWIELEDNGRCAGIDCAAIEKLIFRHHCGRIRLTAR
jgi:uncharacterized protein YuzE